MATNINLSDPTGLQVRFAFSGLKGRCYASPGQATNGQGWKRWLEKAGLEKVSGTVSVKCRYLVPDTFSLCADASREDAAVTRSTNANNNRR